MIISIERQVKIMKLNGKKLKDANVVKVLDSGNLAFCSILVVRDDNVNVGYAGVAGHYDAENDNFETDDFELPVCAWGSEEKSDEEILDFMGEEIDSESVDILTCFCDCGNACSCVQ